MFLNYIKIAFRNVLKNKISSVVNILGLTLGITTGLSVFLIIQYENDYDIFHSRRDRIFRVVRHEKSPVGDEIYSASLPFPAKAALSNDFPQLKITQVFATSTSEFEMRHGDDRWQQDGLLFADSTFLTIFDFVVLEGNGKEALKHPNQVLITEEFAKIHFGDKSPLGSTLAILGDVKVEVAGILENPPSNSSLPFSVIISIDTFNKDFLGGLEYDNWGTSLGFSCYMLLPDEVDESDILSQLGDFTNKYLTEKNGKSTSYFLQALRDVHFDQRFAGSNIGYTVDTTYLLILGSVGFLVLMLACINYINLSTAVSIRKAREVGVRKVFGATRSQLILQNIGETFLITFIALLMALGLMEELVPVINQFLKVKLSYSFLNNGSITLYLVLVLVGLTLSSGFYPAWVLSSYKTVAALKNKVNSTGNSQFWRISLVTSQFVVSQILIIGTIVISEQMNYFRNKPLGFDKDLIMSVGLDPQNPLKQEQLKMRLLQVQGVENVTCALGAPTSENEVSTVLKIDGRDEDFRVRIKPADKHYLKTFDLQLVAGNWFLKEDKSGTGDEFIVNEELVGRLGYRSAEEILGKKISLGINNASGLIVGVVKNFHMRSLQEVLEPVVLFQFPRLYFEANIKISDKNISSTIQSVQKAWTDIFPDSFFSYYFLDEALARSYEREEKMYTLFQLMTGIAIVIGCLGLFGLISFTVVQRTKEVGVRKVLGASVTGITLLITKDFTRLLLIAFIIAAPIAWYSMRLWLQGFAYRIELDFWIFALGFGINLAVAFTTIGYQSVKAALANPIASLNEE